MVSREQLYEALKTNFGFDNFKGNQEAIIRSLLDGHDTFVLMPTGGGKSLCYQLPALLMDGTAVVVSPLIALMKNQVDAMRNFSSADDIAHFLNSSLNKAAIATVKRDVRKGKTRLLYVAPESLTKQENIDFLRSVNISFYAIDESHCISEWGHDFRPEYRRLRPIINEIGSRPVIALTATATPRVQHDIQKNLGMNDARVFKSSFNRENLYYEVRPKTSSVDRDIVKFIKNNPGKSGIVYCLSRKKVEELTELLKMNDIRALAYHAGMDGVTRSDNQDAFLHEEVDVIVATIAFGMGIDKPDVRFVIHYDIPKSLEGYYQETGRAGRDGGEGRCIAFYSAKDLRKMEKFIQSKPVTEQEIGRQLLAETAAYAESSVCRRKSLLYYFGEHYEPDRCDNCDNCRSPRKKIEARDFLLALLETLQLLGKAFSPEHIVDILRGRKNIEVRNYGHENLETFGDCNMSDARTLLAVIRQAGIEGYLTKDFENDNRLSITEKGIEFMKNPHSFIVLEDHDYTTDDEEPEATGISSALDPVLNKMLLDLRLRISRRNNLPPYVIFQERSLEAMATFYPVTIEELQTIPGVGVGKAKRYGQDFVNLISNYVEENEIERPQVMRVRTVANHSKVKVSIIQSIDRKIALDELARSKSLDMAGLLDEIESIINSGTKLNINYYLNEILEEDLQEEIFDYLRSSETDDIQAAYEALDGEYTEEEIRLVRIRFISEMGN